MNKIDRKFMNFVNDIKSLSSLELYHKMRENFNKIPLETRNSCIDFFNKFNYWGIIDIDNNNYEEIELKQKTLKKHINDFEWLYSRLEDYRSKALLFSILNNWYSYDFVNTSKSKEYLFDDYFDLDIVKCCDEVFVDLGAYVGDTVCSFIDNYGDNSYKKIYCYEITEDSFRLLKENTKQYKNIIYKNKGVSDKEGFLYLDENGISSSANRLSESKGGNVEIVTLDNDIKDKITMIKADVEGFEQQILRGAREHIKSEHPKLLISVYHKNEDLYKIPKIIHDMDNTYKFYLRFNSSPIYPTEITLIAI